MADSDFENLPDAPEYKSKTQLKNESHALQTLGLSLVDLSPASLAAIPMDEELREAIDLARRINRKKEGFRRQIQFIGKLMRSRDVTQIEQALAASNAQHKRANQRFHLLEQTRDKLLQGGDQAIQTLLVDKPELDRQKLRQLVRQANKEQQQNKPPKAARELFQYLKAML